MNFDATPLNIKNILSVKQRYVIPRNQREFSWERLQLEELWQDIVRNIKLNEDGQNLDCSEYFIGTIVLSGADSDDVLEVVDGQQRFSVITILLSLISRKLRALGQNSLADDIFKTYIVTVSPTFNRGQLASNGEVFIEKLSKNSDRAYYKLKYQDREEHEIDISCEEDKKISYAGIFLTRKLGKKSLCSALLRDGASSYDKSDYIFCLTAVYRMITNYLKLVKISVGKEDDAYDIFEVLNARGINLSSIDLIKNKIFQSCTQTYPVDVAKTKWDHIVSQIEERDSNSTIADYIRSWWLSTYNYIGEDQLYRSFKREVQDDSTSLTSSLFLEHLYADVEFYCKIIAPSLDDWPQPDQREIYNALKAFEIFNVSIPRPFILSLLRKRKEKPRSLSQSKLIECLNVLESFHFKFNAVCRLRPSGIDAKYSVLAVKMNAASNKTEISSVIDEAINYFNEKKPTEKVFKEAFIKNIAYTNKKSGQRKLVIYIFDRLERSLRATKELKMDIVSLEHIGSQSNTDESVVGCMGNLLPLCFSINEDCKNYELKRKIPFYEKSDLKLVLGFVSESNARNHDWSDDLIKERTEALATQVFNQF
ncbi:DUF262 domain-containing HNH endonuclease family protein [Enterobacter kobei]|uniref:DUF262 domain-containing protein n=1 Tax=Enterobacter kobei TaxID=208224 RepID=UPI002003C252|nr:DUF262 domain-containing protein [Enterobacter kobei]MCK7113144.1 DUF262 domain-containing HNH endonuclease family protein [Enterobacter kobei]